MCGHCSALRGKPALAKQVWKVNKPTFKTEQQIGSVETAKKLTLGFELVGITDQSVRGVVFTVNVIGRGDGVAPNTISSCLHLCV